MKQLEFCQRILSIVMVFSLSVLPACQGAELTETYSAPTESTYSEESETPGAELNDPVQVDIIGQYEPIQSFQHLLEATSLVVDGHVVNVERFGDYYDRFEFEVEAVHYGQPTTDDPLYIYAARDRLELGEDYLIFAFVDEVPFYPHPVTALTYDLAFSSEVEGFQVDSLELATSRDELFGKLKNSDGFDQAVITRSSTSRSNVEDVWKQSDALARIRIDEAGDGNPYITFYDVTIEDYWSDDVLHVNIEGEQLLQLETGLKEGEAYYVMLQIDDEDQISAAGHGDFIYEVDAELPDLLSELINDSSHE